MRTLIIALMASASALFTLSSAQAADAVYAPDVAPVASDNFSASSNWAGGYAGATLGYNWGRFNDSSAMKDGSFSGGLYGGYNMQTDQMVYGVEGDLNYTPTEKSTGGVKSKQGVNASLRARLGFDANPFLLYGTAGVATSNIEASSTAGTQSKNLWGWTAGVGAEAVVTGNITARVEYRYSDYGAKNFQLGNTTVRRDYDEHAIKVGVGFKF